MLHECFADEIAVDFPSVARVVDRMRDAFLGERADADVLCAEVSLSPREACAGLVVPFEVPVRVTCLQCGGRGESWTEACDLCGGRGESRIARPVRVSLPPGVSHGARIRFRLRSPNAPSVRVELHVSIRSQVL
ncbi:MAG: hypothetical protein HY047_19035 [Acidobacteria bacterium]|nr:hypothetical protein [Acidobacteriota bacterium]